MKKRDGSSDSSFEGSNDDSEDVTCGFLQGQVVWIKVKGYSIWPGTVGCIIFIITF